MPTYQYACTECGHRLEVVQSFSDEPLSECPQCEGRLRKVFNSVGIVFKGSGFYRNDSREKPAAKKEKSDGDRPDKSGGDTKQVDAPAAKDSAKSSAEKSSPNGSAKPSNKPTGSSTGSSSGSSSGSSTAGSAA
ncbi:MAG: FmdB family transcriptional regulator [Sporichthyaceae bacterium]|nr:FmdB family transcriptional regulator [Sporichthyaceae bacterium]